MGRNLAKLAAAVLALFLTLIPVLPAWATLTPPDKLEVISLRVFRNLAQPGDMFLASRYNIEWYSANNTPNDAVDETFTFRLLNVAGTSEVGAALPYAFFDRGYDTGFVCIYWDNVTAPTWGLAYQFIIAGQPSAWPIPPSVTYTVKSSDYDSSTGQVQNQTDAGDYIIAVARKLEASWAHTLTATITTGTVLNPTGESYFTTTQPGLQYLAPGIFSVSTTNPNYPTRTATNAQANVYVGRFNLSFLGVFLNNQEATTHVPATIITGAFVVLLVVVAVGFSQHWWQRQEPGWVAGGILFVGASVEGLVHMGIIGVAGLLCIIFLGRTFLFREGS